MQLEHAWTPDSADITQSNAKTCMHKEDRKDMAQPVCCCIAANATPTQSCQQLHM